VTTAPTPAPQTSQSVPRRHAPITAAARKIGVITMLGCASLLMNTPAHTQAFPDHPIKFVIPYTPGGNADVVVRPVSARWQELLGQPVVLEYKPGAGTNIGSAFVAKSKPDGYTILLTSNSMAISAAVAKGLQYDPVKDLIPVGFIGYSPFSIGINAKLPVQNLRELIAYAKANPGKLVYGSSGNGGVVHLASEQFKVMAKIDMLHVPYNGGGPQINALLAGDIQVMVSPAANFVQHVATGRLRMLAVAASKRMPGLDLPTATEAGLPGYEAGVTLAVHTATGTPRPLVDKLNATLNTALRERALNDTLTRAGVLVLPGTPEDLGLAFTQEVQRWQTIIRDAGIRID